MLLWRLVIVVVGAVYWLVSHPPTTIPRASGTHQRACWIFLELLLSNIAPMSFSTAIFPVPNPGMVIIMGKAGGRSHRLRYCRWRNRFPIISFNEAKSAAVTKLRGPAITRHVSLLRWLGTCGGWDDVVCNTVRKLSILRKLLSGADHDVETLFYVRGKLNGGKNGSISITSVTSVWVCR